MSQIQQELKETLLLFRQMQKVEQHHRELKAQLSEEVKSFRQIAKAVKKEERDVALLEKTSMRSLFHKVLGDREKQIEKERQEYLQVALKYNELSKSIEVLEYEISILAKKLMDFDKLENRYNDLIKLREKELMKTNPGIGEELLLIHKKVDHRQVLLKDIREAIRTGKEAERILLAMEKELQSARNWGRYDTAGGKGSSSYLKHRAIDRAKDLAYRVRHALLLFRRELSDIFKDASITLDVNLEGFSSFTDIFFDNLITDWIVQQKINRAYNDVRKVRGQVRHALGQLEKEMPIIEQEIDDLTDERETMILQAENQ